MGDEIVDRSGVHDVDCDTEARNNDNGRLLLFGALGDQIGNTPLLGKRPKAVEVLFGDCAATALNGRQELLVIFISPPCEGS
jgi:hypothetical protein